MATISESVRKRDHLAKLSGMALYVGDYRDDDILVGKMLRSSKAKARVIKVKVPMLPDGYYYVDAKDVPGDNNVNIIKDDTPVFARETVEYIGEPIGMFCGPDKLVVEQLLRDTEVVYEELEPVLDIDTSDVFFFEYEYKKGDIAKAFAEADRVIEETFETGYQEQVYLETQAMMAEVLPDGKVYIHGSMQCPYYIKNAATRALGLPPEKVRIAQDVTGGGFGGKEAWPSILSCQVAVAAVATGKKIRCVFDRREDIEYTSKRHPSKDRYRVAIKDGRVTAMDIDITYNGGAYTTLSAVVLQRGMICANGVYNVPNLLVKGRVAKTNTVPNGAFRGFGAPQTFFTAEMMMTHVAKALGEDPLAFKERHMVVQGDSTSTSGKFHFNVPLPAMIAKVDSMCDYRKKKAAYSKPQTGRYRRGIGMSLFFHGAGFTGSAERDLIKAVVKLKKTADGNVHILASNTDMGQGLRTTFPKIAAHELGLPLERIYYEYPDTDEVPDSGPTVASRSLMNVGELIRRAAVKLKEQWVDGEEQLIEEHYVQPDFLIPFSLDTFSGDAYPTYSWGVVAMEIEADTVSGTTKVLGAYGSYDVGTPMDYNIVLGQMEGGTLQSIGYASMEQMNYDNKGRIRNNAFSDYIIPTAMDVPKMDIDLYVAESYPFGPYGAKGAGELPCVGAPAAYIEAMEQALGDDVMIQHIPFSAEDALKAMRGGQL